MQREKGVRNISTPRFTIVGRVKAAEHADGGNPAVHVLLGLSHQVPGAFLRLQVKNEAALQLLLREREASIHLSESTTDLGQTLKLKITPALCVFF